MKKQLALPKVLETYREQFEQTMLPFVRLRGVLAKTGPYDSKFGGTPYFPNNESYPEDSHGVPMKLLAQLNFAQLPALEDYPDKGILQFYISVSDDVYGIDFDEPLSQKDFRVLYFEELFEEQELMSDFSFVRTIDSSPFEEDDIDIALFAVLDEEMVSVGDVRFKTHFHDDAWHFFKQYGHEADTTWGDYNDLHGGQGHKIGGYAYFTQEDPRVYEHQSHSRLLFQIDTDYSMGILWGDCGVANFFIREEDLKNRNFDQVLYNWDCS
ncbi:YwqG family protein [Aureibacillus halotolerans]|uniref:Uncharacterized protein YwqG n=1 Tax=Aureibacillus halotolerans TaxID=1508390 RepID=A0A4R6TYR7_9BACI|nr:YwqG family protein [Aureibacillus halotolerans]TDQ37473.1 uncharacterized protein YwqG [Aureibacillus halotolerans]